MDGDLIVVMGQREQARQRKNELVRATELEKFYQQIAAQRRAPQISAAAHPSSVPQDGQQVDSVGVGGDAMQASTPTAAVTHHEEVSLPLSVSISSDLSALESTVPSEPLEVLEARAVAAARSLSCPSIVTACPAGKPCLVHQGGRTVCWLGGHEGIPCLAAEASR